MVRDIPYVLHVRFDCSNCQHGDHDHLGAYPCPLDLDMGLILILIDKLNIALHLENPHMLIHVNLTSLTRVNTFDGINTINLPPVKLTLI